MTPLLNAKELAEELNKPVSGIYDLTRTGAIPCVKISARCYRYDFDEVLAVLKAKAANN
jgi:hypothetical protein